MKDITGTQRVVIEHVNPEINDGQFPAKRVVGEEVRVSADIYGDGHEKVRAKLLYRFVGKRKWEVVSMKHLGNDRWEASFIAEKMGRYEFTLEGWIDHYLTYQHDLQKKYEAGQEIEVELKIGAQLMRDAAKRTKAKEGGKLTKWAETLEEPKSIGDAYKLAVNGQSGELMEKYGSRVNMATYEKVLTVEVERPKALFSTWYELFPRSTAQEEGRHGTFKDVEKVLPRIAEMGFDVLYLPPIHPIGESNRKGKNNSVTAEAGEPGSPWAIGGKEGGHKAIHSELGSLEDFRHLVKTANEEYGIEVALDYALQCSPDHPYVEEHPQWFKWRPDGTVQYAENPPKKYQDVLPINFETQDWKNLWLELKSIVDYWIEQGVKIFRVDNPHTKPFVFWEWLIAEIHKKHPEVIFLAEAFTRPRIMERLAKIGFTQSYTYFTWRDTKKEFTQYLTELAKEELREYFRPNFWPNTPDILTPNLAHQNEAAFMSRFLLAATMSSSYGIYGPVFEFGLNEPHPDREEYIDNEKYEIKNWDWDKHTPIRDLITKVNRIRKNNPALQTTWHIEFLDNDNQQVLTYLKTDQEGKNRLLIIVSLDSHNVQSGWVRVPLSELNIPENHTFVVHDLLNDTEFKWQNEWNYFELNPRNIPAHIFRIEEVKSEII
jgi:starch synthase (maltosyl-transferring)